MDREGKMERMAPGTPTHNIDKGIDRTFLSETIAEAKAVGRMWLTKIRGSLKDCLDDSG